MRRVASRRCWATAARLVAEGDRGALAEALVEMLESPERRVAAAECGLRQVRERHSLSGTVAAMQRVYVEAAGSG